LIGTALTDDDGIMIKRTSVDSTVKHNSVEGQHFGGLVGLLDGAGGTATIEETKFTGEVAGGIRVGGLVGQTGIKLDITDSFSNAAYEVEKDGRAGGLVGAIAGPMTVENTYVAGVDAANNPGSGEYFGGIGGDLIGTNPSDIDIVDNSFYFDTDDGVEDVYEWSSGAPPGNNNISGVKTPGSAAMKGSSADDTMSEFDFDDTWVTRPGDFPDLRTFN
jgi:hypothetical protein